jgi:hypothetical protein
MHRMPTKKSHSWWWDSHISPKNSKWLAENLEGNNSAFIEWQYVLKHLCYLPSGVACSNLLNVHVSCICSIP